jgi:hypothetical protein
MNVYINNCSNYKMAILILLLLFINSSFSWPIVNVYDDFTLILDYYTYDGVVTLTQETDY